VPAGPGRTSSVAPVLCGSGRGWSPWLLASLAQMEVAMQINACVNVPAVAGPEELAELASD